MIINKWSVVLIIEKLNLKVVNGWVFALLMLAVINGFVLWRWVKADTRPVSWDEAIHTSVAYDYQDRIKNEGFLEVLKPAYFHYPPLYHLTLAAALKFVDDPADAGALANFFYLSMLMAAVFLIGKELLNSWAGFTAAFLISSYPMVAEIARVPLIDLALTSWVSWAVLCLIKSDNFKKPSWSIGFGVSFALGMLTKWTASVYVLGPFIYAASFALQEKRWRWLMASIGVAVLIMFPWFSINLIPMLKFIGDVTGMRPPSGLVFQKALSWFWYPYVLLEQLNLFFLLLFLPGLAAVFWRRKLWPVFLWFLVTFFLFSLISNKNTRYSLPALPAIAILSVAWLPSFRGVPYLVVNAVTALFFVCFHFFPGSGSAISIGSVRLPLVSPRPPYAVNWQHEPIIRLIQEKKDPDRSFCRVLILSNAANFHSNSLNVTLKRLGIQGISFRGPSKKRWFEFAEFILLKTGDIGPPHSIGHLKECIDFVQNPPPWFHQVYKKVGQWPLPDGGEAILFHCEPQPVDVAGMGGLNLQLEEFEIPNIQAENLSIRAIPLSSADTARGRMKELRLSCGRLSYKGIEFQDVSLRLEKPQINLPLFMATQEIQLLNLEHLKPRAVLSSETFVAYAAKKVKKLEDPEIRFEGPRVFIKAKMRGIPIGLRFSIWVKDKTLLTRMEKLTIAHLPFPLVFIRAVTDYRVPLTPYEEAPFALDIGSIRGAGDKIIMEPVESL
ncbi:MAG: glycosyltransferase family 39 protein [Elusimicrobia bacterium]|nr:glycosyltransferase family 39 protein [Candidatus Obscuribacterium magneticum]